MKHIELDPENTFTIGAESNDNYILGELYQVTQHDKKERTFELTGISKVVADFELTPEQSTILKDMLGFAGVTVEQYLQHAVLSRLQADIDDFYRGDDPRRERAMAAADKWTVTQ